jgi:hypothetical protein
VSAELARIAVVGAGDPQAKAFLEALKDGGCNAAQVVPLGARLGALELDLSEDTTAEVFLPLEKEHLDGCHWVVLFSRDGAARKAVRKWIREGGQILLDMVPDTDSGAGWLDPLSPEEPVIGEFGLSFPEAHAVYVSRFLGHLSGRDLGSLSAHLMLPASRFGEQGVLELYQQAVSLLAFKPVPTEVLTRQTAFNCWPAPGAGGADLFPAQVRSLASMPQLRASCVALQTGSFHSTALSVVLEMSDAKEAGVMLSEAVADDERFSAWRGEGWPSVIEVAGEDKPVVAAGALDPLTLWIWIVYDNAKAGKGALAARWLLGQAR